VIKPFAAALAFCALLLAAPACAQTTPVQVATLTPAIWRSGAEVAASLVAARSATLAPARAGLVTAVSFQSGQAVAAGAILVQLDDEAETAQLALDQARLTQAASALRRTRNLLEIAGASQSALEDATAAAAEAAAQVALDQANLAQTRITAPFAGTAGIRNIDPGDYLQAGQAVVTLTAPGPLRVLFAIPQSEAGSVKPGDPFTLAIPAGPGAAMAATGHLTALSPAQDTATNAQAAEGRLDNPPAAFIPGMAGVVTIATGAPQPAFAVPTTALNDSTLGPFLFVLSPTNTLTTVYVSIDATEGGTTLIAPGTLSAGQKIVALGGFKLTDGATVTPEAP
jgi:RND family efflux transporter MFP subunit